ncbi:LapD/MoxY N-terminal periplasmic domain-containing protein [Zhongshania guokunii]|uniref:LapD/MoxY N-terminal periplasmic domain-containing protein n=1 Tax=Zhongshania guokunii TaxID=641783 RepID=A0ABV3U481_9GAMM
MTLFRQIAILVAIGFALLLGLISVDSLRQSTNLLRGQLQSTVQDTATVLAISMSTTGSGEDVAAIETLFNAVFDSGYYSDIKLVSSDDGRVIFEKRRPLAASGVPGWFVDAVHLEPETGRADVMKGWVPIAQLEISLHPGFAYAGLYKRLVSTTQWFVLIFVAVLILLWLVLDFLLKPLKAVYRQAIDIQENRYTEQESLPRTLELRRVVQTMNRLSRNVKEIFEEQEHAVARYQSLLYQDELTGLRNRRFLMTELNAIFSGSANFHGVMAMIKINGLETLREQSGYQHADELVQQFASCLKDALAQNSHYNYARISEDEFALIIQADRELATAVIERLFSRFQSQCSIEQGLVSLNAGVAELSSADAATELLSELDLSLSQAQSIGAYQLCFPGEQSLSLPQGKLQWRSWFQRALDDNKFYLVSQLVYDKYGAVIHREIFVRVDDEDGREVPAGIFMPMALSLGFGMAIYRKVNELLPVVNDSKYIVPFAVNFSDLFISGAHAFEELNQMLALFQKSPGTLCVEVSHEAVRSHPQRCQQLADAVKRYGHAFGVDHLDLNIPMHSLQTINPEYVKISAQVLDDLGAENNASGYQALRNVVRTLDIQLIAVGVDQQPLRDRLLAMGVDGMQGNYLGRPERII